MRHAPAPRLLLALVCGPPAAMNGAVQPAGVPTKPTKLNHNVRVLLVYATILSIFSSLVTQTPLAAYILIIRGRSASVGLLVAIASSPEPRLVPALYLLRAWLMNSTFGLTKSILNDFVPKKERGKWRTSFSLGQTRTVGKFCRRWLYIIKIYD